jgi:Zn-dependent protease
MVIGTGYWLGCGVSLVMHEAAHICAARALGIRVKRAGVNWRGPYIVREQGTPLANAMVSAAGPVINLLLAVLLWNDWPSCAIANLVLGLSNLLPIPSSDGRRILRELSVARSAQAPARPLNSLIHTTVPLE